MRTDGLTGEGEEDGDGGGDRSFVTVIVVAGVEGDEDEEEVDEEDETDEVAAKNSKSFVSRLFPSFVSCCFVSSEKPDKQNENSCVFLLNNAKEKQDKYYDLPPSDEAPLDQKHQGVLVRIRNDLMGASEAALLTGVEASAPGQGVAAENRKIRTALAHTAAWEPASRYC
nr:hypothetical protein BaRGS_001129 [Batillaria attramentaria]